MKSTLLAGGLAAALASASCPAFAKAYVTGTFAGVHVGQVGSGWNGGYLGPVGVDLAPGDSQTFVYSFSVTLHTDGLPATRAWSDCATIPYSMDCGAKPTGFETAQFDFDLFPPRDASGYWNYAESGQFFGSLTAPAGGGTATYTGAFTITETATKFRDQPFGQYDVIIPYAFAFVDSAPIPEAPTAALLVAGLGLLAARRRPSYTGVSGEMILL